jgi:hypothetical protein
MLRYLAIRVVWLLGLLLAMSILACSNGIHSKAVDLIKDAQNQTTAQAGTLNQLGKTKGVQGDPRAGALTDQAKKQNQAIGKDLGAAKPIAQTDANNATNAKNAVVVRLTWIGIGLLVLGIAAGLGGILASTYLGSLAAYFRTGGVITALTGIAALYVAYHWSAFNRALDVVVIAGAAAGVLWLVLHYVTASEVTAIEQWIVTKFGAVTSYVKGLFIKPAVKKDVA